MTDETLKDIKSLLEDVKSLLLAVNSDKLDDAKKKLLRPGSSEQQVYDLCDGENTNSDMASKLNKTVDNINAVLSNLRKKKLIRYSEYDGKKVHIQVF
ncbi:MAG: hypothetical protein B2I17_08905 [Thermoplasmatales archaeon B_DKE]|nr:MAG: hypothetical protein B2I17_08905 [Thermoplasmatales archaeon B_DKE]